jgi:hypothetical protein
MIAEPTEPYPESVFEAAVIEAIREILADAKREYLLVQRFGLDVAVFIRTSTGVTVRLVEAKAYRGQRAGGVGFGNGRGEGPQVELLCCSEGSMALLSPVVRWIIADATLPPGTARYALFDSARASAAAMSGASKGKQNNFSMSALKPHYREWRVLLGDLKTFLLG